MNTFEREFKAELSKRIKKAKDASVDIAKGVRKNFEHYSVKEAVIISLHNPNSVIGLNELKNHNILDLSLECLVLQDRWNDYFDDKIKEKAKNNLNKIVDENAFQKLLLQNNE